MSDVAKAFRPATFVGLVALAGPIHSQTPESPQSRLRPIGAPSAVDRYRAPAPPNRAETRVPAASTASDRDQRSLVTVRQAAWMRPQQFTPPSLLPGNGQMPSATPGDSVPVPTPSLPLGSPGTPSGSAGNPPVTSTPRSLPAGPNTYQPVPSSSDLTPLAAPQLSTDFATLGNCCCISAPSSYTAASGIGCGPPVTYAAPPTFVPPPAEIAAPAAMPPLATVPAGTTSRPHRPLISLGQELKPVELGQGIIGQPVAYVPGEPFRNFLRYLFP